MFKEPINRFSGRAARKSTFVIALVAVLAAIAGVTAESASAASFTDGTSAQLEIDCYTVVAGGTETNTIRLKAWPSSWLIGFESGIWMQYQISVNGSSWGQSSGWVKVGGGYISNPQVYSGPYTRGGMRLSFRVQFAKVVNGAWQYSPNGKYEYAVHSETLTTPYQTVGANTGSSCAFA